MPVTTGLVQRIFMDSGGASAVQACVFIGPTPANVELLFVRRQASDPPNIGAFKNAMLDGLTLALTSRREVIVEHPDAQGGIYSVLIR